MDKGKRVNGKGKGDNESGGGRKKGGFYFDRGPWGEGGNA